MSQHVSAYSRLCGQRLRRTGCAGGCVARHSRPTPAAHAGRCESYEAELSLFCDFARQKKRRSLSTRARGQVPHVATVEGQREAVGAEVQVVPQQGLAHTTRVFPVPDCESVSATAVVAARRTPAQICIGGL